MTRQVSRTPVRYPSGVSNTINGADPRYQWRMYGANDPSRYYSYHNDFYSYASGDWTATDVGTNTAALATGEFGLLTITTGTDNPASKYLQHPVISWYPTVGKQLWFEAKVRPGAGTITLPDFVIGLQSLDTTPLAVADGIYFIKANAAATVDFIVKSAATSATTTNSAVATMAASTFMTLGFYYDGASAIEYFVNRVKVGTSVATNMPLVGLTLSFGVNATTAAAQALSVDYVSVHAERVYANSP